MTAGNLTDAREQPMVVHAQAADLAAEFMETHSHTAEPLTPAAQKALRRKLLFFILGTTVAVSLMMFIDKSTLSYGVLLGVMEETKIDNRQYNNLNTLFYAGYIIGQVPGQWLIQKTPLRYYVSGSVFLWSILIFLHCTATNYGGLIALRFILGMVEAPVLPALEVTMSMFFTPTLLHTLQPIFWISCVASPIPTGLLGYALLFSKSVVTPWKFFMITSGGLTFLLALWCLYIYPSNPMTARFLSESEKVHLIHTIQQKTRSSIEQKTFKPHQAREALTDPASWLFALAAFCLMLSNNLAFQQSLLYLQIGVSNLGSTLVWVASGGFASAVALVASFLLRSFPGYSALWASLWCVPAIAGGIGMVALPWDRTIPLLACLLLACNTWGMTYIISFGWATSSCAGYTKKTTRGAMFMAAYGISNIISPQLWNAGGAPRYYGTWAAQIVVSWVGTPVCLLGVRWVLVRRNRERIAWIREREAAGVSAVSAFLTKGGGGADDGARKEVDVAMLDLTDLENRQFIYPL
ncbi:major facilitator superfamily domain-containing protein [Aspergillus carlsbadensis]|nr:major facilitator superfamily domain-containing protein [Aspergillus carlsbadensis]